MFLKTRLPEINKIFIERKRRMKNEKDILPHIEEKQLFGMGKSEDPMKPYK